MKTGRPPLPPLAADPGGPRLPSPLQGAAGVSRPAAAQTRSVDQMDAAVAGPSLARPSSKLGWTPGEAIVGSALAGLKPDRATKASEEFRALAEKAQHPDLKRLLAEAAVSLQRVQKSTTLATPRVVLSTKLSRPDRIEGHIERRVKGNAPNYKTVIVFKPKAESGGSPFNLDPEQVAGLPSGARIELNLVRRGEDKVEYELRAPRDEYADAMLGVVELDAAGKAWVVPRKPGGPFGRVPLEAEDAAALVGRAVIATVVGPSDPGRVARVSEVVGDADSPSARLLEIAADAGRALSFPHDVLREVARIEAAPGITLDPARGGADDYRDLPFCTVDNDHSKDLDQAMCIQRREDGGYRVLYAIADTAHFVKPGGALHRWAERIGLTTYLPDGRSLPIFPKAISEGLCSLNPDVDRKAFIVKVDLDADGKVIGREVDRGLIRSRAHLSYRGLQEYHEIKAFQAGAGLEVTGRLDPGTLEAVLDVLAARGAPADGAGKRPITAAARKLATALEGKADLRLLGQAAARALAGESIPGQKAAGVDPSEGMADSARYAGHPHSETLDLVAEVGAKRMALAAARGVVPSDDGRTELRVDPRAENGVSARTDTRYHCEKWNEQISLLANEMVGAVAAEAGIVTLHRFHPEPGPDRLDAFRDRVDALGVPWPAEQSLAQYVAGLDSSHPTTPIIQRMVTRVNRPASYTSEAHGHSALKLEHYDHFTAPMRRLPDQKIAEALAAHAEGAPVPNQNRPALVRLERRMERADQRERDIARASEAFLTARIFAGRQGEVIPGRIVDVGPNGAVVRLDDPPLEVSFGRRALTEAGFGGVYDLVEGGTAWTGPAGRFAIGQSLDLTVSRVDEALGQVDITPTALLAAK